MNSNAKLQLAVNAKAFAKIQEYENMQFDLIPRGVIGNSYEVEDFSDELGTAADAKIPNPVGKVYVQSLSGSLLKVRVRVEYKNGAADKFIEYATYSQLGGVGR